MEIIVKGFEMIVMIWSREESGEIGESVGALTRELIRKGVKIYLGSAGVVSIKI
jgi:hypothetical protein